MTMSEIYSLVDELSPSQIERLVGHLSWKLSPTMMRGTAKELAKERTRQLCNIVAQLTNIDPLEKSRSYPRPILRAMIAEQLIGEGFTTLAIGEAMGKDHSTIMHYKSVAQGFRDKYIDNIYKQFKERV